MARVILTAGLGFGDEGKGSVVDYLARQHNPEFVVRYNGGAQAGHNVATPDGKHHTFSQFGSGTFAGVPTFLSRHMLVNPIFAFAEAKHLEELGIGSPMSLLHVDKNALVTTPYHVSLNRMKEIGRGQGRHGSCGMGIGETVAHAIAYPEDALYVRDLDDVGMMATKLKNQRSYAFDWYMREADWPNIGPGGDKEFQITIDKRTRTDAMEIYKEFMKKAKIMHDEWFRIIILGSELVIFEGAQGVLLDQDYGFFPHVTRSNCTFENALEILPNGHDVERWGIVRAYMTRHGAGPLLTERSDFNEASATDHNKMHDYQGAFRSGVFDLIATKYAIDVLGGIDGLVVNHLDRLKVLPDPVPVCTAYTMALKDPPWFGPHGTLKIPTKRGDLEDLTKRTESLKTLVPFYEDSSKMPAVFARDVARILKVQLRLLGEGPTANDKTPV